MLAAGSELDASDGRRTLVTMPIARALAAAFLLAFVATGCGGDDAPTAVGVELACTSKDDARVQVEGFLRLPERIALTDRAVIDLFTERSGRGDRVSVEMVLGTEPNQLERPEAGYTVTSLRVHDAGGTVVTLNDRVSLIGTIDRQGDTCVVRDPIVTALERT